MEPLVNEKIFHDLVPISSGSGGNEVDRTLSKDRIVDKFKIVVYGDDIKFQCA